jgi:hypothetical protein
LGGAADDLSLVIERLALSTGFTKRGNATEVFAGSVAGRVGSASAKDVKFSLRCEGLSTAGFDQQQQQSLEQTVAKGYGLKKQEDAKVSIVGFYAAGSDAGLKGKGFAGEGGTCVVVDMLLSNFKTPKHALTFVTKAKGNPVPMGTGSKALYGNVSFEKPPTVGGSGGVGGGGGGGSDGVPGAPTIVAATAGDGEVKVLITPPLLSGLRSSLAGKAAGGGAGGGGEEHAYDPTVVEIEVVSAPGRLRASAPVGEPVIVKGLANGTKYRFTAHARNASGWGPVSSPSNPLVPGDLTAAPLPPEIAAVTTSDVEVEVAVLVAPAGKYFLRPATLVEVKSEPDNVTAFAPPGVPVLLQGLRPGVSYRFRSRAKNVNGWSRSSKPTASVTLTAGAGGGGVGEAATGSSSGGARSSVKSDENPSGYYRDKEEEDLTGDAQQLLLDHNLEKDLQRKGKTPLEVLLHKQRIKRGQGKDTDLVDGGYNDTDGKGPGPGGKAGAGPGGGSGGVDEDISAEETMALEANRLAAGEKKRFSVKEEVNMGLDIFSKQMKDVEGLAPSDNKFLKRFVGLMATKGMMVFKHGRRARRQTVVRMDPQGMKITWDSKAKKKGEDSSIDLTHECQDVVKGQVFSWYRSISMDPECCVSVVCKPPAAAKGALGLRRGSLAAPKRLDMECESRDDANLRFAALSVLNTARQPGNHHHHHDDDL